LITFLASSSHEAAASRSPAAVEFGFFPSANRAAARASRDSSSSVVRSLWAGSRKTVQSGGVLNTEVS
jgi:hypothetical protein